MFNICMVNEHDRLLNNMYNLNTKFMCSRAYKFIPLMVLYNIYVCALMYY